MSVHQDRIDQLNQKLEVLLSKQEAFAKELMVLYKEIEAVKQMRSDDLVARPTTIEETFEPSVPEATIQPSIELPVERTDSEAIAETVGSESVAVPQQDMPSVKTAAAQMDGQVHIENLKGKSNLEKFIGENLINKIGIAITVIGVAIGAKYSIENNLISPLTRIILGYLVGLVLIGFGIKLKEKYDNFSAVLVSGALAIMYFITFAAYSFYGLFPQLMAFALMLLFTVFGVVAALNYNKQIIAHIGLVGAYAVPFLLGDDSGNVATLFAYTAIINVGILTISLKKYWKPLFYSSFVLTWLIYISWSALSYRIEEHFGLALIFVSLFFFIFYVTFLAYKLSKSEKFLKSDVVLVLLNSFIFYALGYGFLSHHETGKHFLGLFTLGNAIVHFVVATLIYRKKLADRNLFYLISGMVLIFITIAIPVQLDGNWVTLLWTLQASLLFWVGRTKHIPFYEKLSYPLMVLGFLSLTQDWAEGYGGYFDDGDAIRPILNTYFLTSVLFIAAFTFIHRINGAKQASNENNSYAVSRIMAFIIPAILIFTTYAAFFLEIEHYGQQRYMATEVAETMQNEGTYSHYNYDLKDFSNVWLFNYTLLFLSVLAFANIKKFQDRVLGIVTLAASLIASLLFLTGGLYMLSELRESYLDRATNELYNIGFLNVGIRYVAFAFFALLLVVIGKLTRQKFMKIDFGVPSEIGLHICILWILSSELLNWMDIVGSNQAYKLGLSILWGVYALLLVAIGIRKSKAYLRIGGMVLFGITLIKLFFYDIASLNTISKTIVFVSLGILLLIISFLYTKYKDKISEDKIEPSH